MNTDRSSIIVASAIVPLALATGFLLRGTQPPESPLDRANRICQASGLGVESVAEPVQRPARGPDATDGMVAAGAMPYVKPSLTEHLFGLPSRSWDVPFGRSLIPARRDGSEKLRLSKT